MLILDEPTNHLDIESREALVEALTAYSGAVILVSHDMHLLGLVADRLWLVRGGHVAPYEGDLESYRAALLSGDKPAKPARAKPARRRASRDQILALRQEVRTCELRMDKLHEMRDKIAAKLADPAMYDAKNAPQAAQWQKKYAEVMEGIDRAEMLWLRAEERLAKAEG